MADSQRPDIIVGIDIGQTCSGVAYSLGPDWCDPRPLVKWPSYDGIQRAEKVATRIAYNKSTHELTSWGFGCRMNDQQLSVHEHFKLILDSDYEDDRGISCQQARQWYYDYLRCLHGEIERFFKESVPRWQEKRVEYSFSTPTTWRNPAMIATLQRLIESAGFAATDHQTVRMALTEAEAAAIEATTTQCQAGDIFLICDAGGGTTDVNLMRVKSADHKVVLEPLDHVEGESIGSTLIDFWMQSHIGTRLELIKEHLNDDVLKVAADMVNDRFQNVKHSFPHPSVDEFWLPVKGLAGAQTFPQVDVVDSRMRIERITLKEIFDAQVSRMFNLIDERLAVLAEEFPSEQLSYIILSGGLGSSPYLFERMEERYGKNQGFRSKNTMSVRIIKVLDPQLAVMRGLVRERTQQLGSERSVAQQVFKTRRCRNSYGIVVSQPYDPVRHLGLPTYKKPNADGLWVSNTVDWFIKQGEEIVVEEGRRQQYKITLKENEIDTPRSVVLVTSSLPQHLLPPLATEKGCQHIVSVRYRLTRNDMLLEKGRRWRPLNFKKRLWRADFFFVTKLGPADLRFQILGRNGLLSSDHDSLEVEFAEPGDSKSPRINGTAIASPRSRPSKRSA